MVLFSRNMLYHSLFQLLLCCNISILIQNIAHFEFGNDFIKSYKVSTFVWWGLFLWERLPMEWCITRSEIIIANKQVQVCVYAEMKSHDNLNFWVFVEHAFFVICAQRDWGTKHLKLLKFRFTFSEYLSIYSKRLIFFHFIVLSWKIQGSVQRDSVFRDDRICSNEHEIFDIVEEEIALVATKVF